MHERRTLVSRTADPERGRPRGEGGRIDTTRNRPRETAHGRYSSYGVLVWPALEASRAAGGAGSRPSKPVLECLQTPGEDELDGRRLAW